MLADVMSAYDPKRTSTASIEEISLPPQELLHPRLDAGLNLVGFGVITGGLCA